MEFCSGFYKAGSENKIKQTVSKVFAINFFFFFLTGWWHFLCPKATLTILWKYFINSLVAERICFLLFFFSVSWQTRSDWGNFLSSFPVCVYSPLLEKTVSWESMFVTFLLNQTLCYAFCSEIMPVEFKRVIFFSANSYLHIKKRRSRRFREFPGEIH